VRELDLPTNLPVPTALQVSGELKRLAHEGREIAFPK